MTPYDSKSKELDELEDMEEDQLRAELGRCPGPIDLWSHEVNRRGFIKVGLGGMLSMMMAQFADPRQAFTQTGPNGKAKSCILLWMNGGPSHLDTFDPKPGTANGGPFKAINTRVKGIDICEHLPNLAEMTDKMAIIRGMTSREGNHQRAQYLMHTG